MSYWAGTLHDGRLYSLHRPRLLEDRKIDGIRVTVVLLEDEQYWIVASARAEEPAFQPRGPYPHKRSGVRNSQIDVMTAEQLRAKYRNIEGLYFRDEGHLNAWPTYVYTKAHPFWKVRGIEVVLERFFPAPDDLDAHRYKVVANNSHQDGLVLGWNLSTNMTLAEALTLLRLHGNDL